MEPSLGKDLLFQHIRLLNPIYMNSVSSIFACSIYPVLLIWGSPIDYAASLGGACNARYPEHTWRRERDGHLVLDEAPDAVGKLIAEFAGTRLLLACTREQRQGPQKSLWERLARLEHQIGHRLERFRLHDAAYERVSREFFQAA